MAINPDEQYISTDEEQAESGQPLEEHFLFSPQFKKSAAVVAGVPFAFAAAHAPFGCSEVEVRSARACDPVLFQRHDQHIEIALATGTGVYTPAQTMTGNAPTTFSSSAAVSIATFDPKDWPRSS